MGDVGGFGFGWESWVVEVKVISIFDIMFYYMFLFLRNDDNSVGSNCFIFRSFVV
jgi:hypothetical protein